SSFVTRTYRTKMMAPSALASDSTAALDVPLMASRLVCASGNTSARAKITANVTAKKAMVLCPVFMLCRLLFGHTTIRQFLPVFKRNYAKWPDPYAKRHKISSRHEDQPCKAKFSLSNPGGTHQANRRPRG